MIFQKWEEAKKYAESSWVKQENCELRAPVISFLWIKLYVLGLADAEEIWTDQAPGALLPSRIWTMPERLAGFLR